MNMLKRAERELKLDGFCIYEHGQGRPTLICWDFGYDLDRCEDAALAAVMRIMRDVMTTCFGE